MAIEIQSLLTEAVKLGASDLHLVSWSPPILRINGSLVPMDIAQLTPTELTPDDHGPDEPGTARSV